MFKSKNENNELCNIVLEDINNKIKIIGNMFKEFDVKIEEILKEYISYVGYDCEFSLEKKYIEEIDITIKSIVCVTNGEIVVEYYNELNKEYTHILQGIIYKYKSQ